MEFRILNKIGLSILILGLINLYNIVKYGIIFSIPTLATLYNILDRNKISKILEGGIILLDINNIKIILLISIILFIIFNNINIIFKSGVEKDKRNSLEYELLIGLGLLGLIWILISREFISLYLGLELYSFSYYILILVKESIIIRKISIIYLILSSLASSIILYAFYIIYNTYGSLNLEFIKNFSSFSLFPNNYFIIYLLSIALLFKLGVIPFSFWLIRLYVDLDKRILWYQLTIPKLIFFILFIQFINLFSYHSSFLYILFLISLSSIALAAIGGVFQNKDNLILGYSSILNIGFLLLAFTLILYNDYIYSPLLSIMNNYINDNIWILYQYFFIYFISLSGLFSALFFFYYSSFVFNFRSFYSHPFVYLSLLILIFSFIGLPPFSGFFAKFYLLFILYSSSIITYISFSFFLLFTLISSFFYFKFLFSSSLSESPFPPIKSPEIIDISFLSLILAFTSLFTISYSFLLSYLIPFYVVL